MSWFLALYLSLTAWLLPQTAPAEPSEPTCAELPSPPPAPTNPTWATITPGISNGI